MTPLLDAAALPGFGLDAIFAHAFMRTAFIAGTAIAISSGAVGYFLVLRGQVFTGDALSHVAFTGTLGAIALGLDARAGLFVSCIAVALLFGALGARGRANDTVIGSVFAWVLGLGVFFLSSATVSGGAAGAAGARVLFGSILGLDGTQAAVAVAVSAVAVLTLLVIARPLVFATLDEAVAQARGVPTRALGYVFLAIVGLAAAEASQAVGALLLLGLLATPAGAAHRLASSVYRGLALSVLLAVVAMWAGLLLSYTVPALPPSFSILAVATAVYAATWLGRLPLGGLSRR